ncbi:hypothetical protein Pen02_56200 [Plantactinospora endophytica]|uniref:DUF3040 domain-containing protein n=2 Tax=Plantactinospora endophytica TaxID=673535 RepID=A0ABQ4E7I5_9ACTN|nr:hypothetical protein Pen02_56200 [Plantactinospora endophytica]
MFGDHGQRVLDDPQADLFPRTVRPRFLGLLWTMLVVLAAVATVLLTAITGRLP